MNKQNLMRVYSYLKDKGLNDTAIFALLGNIAVESAYSFDPEVEQAGERSDPAYGLFQFDPRGGLYEPFMEYVAQTEDQNPANPQHQIDFMVDSLTGAYQPGTEYMGYGNVAEVQDAFESGDVERATTLFSENILRPGKPHLDRRVASANTTRELIDQMQKSGVGDIIAFEDPSEVPADAERTGNFSKG